MKRNEMKIAWDKEYKRNKHHAMRETMGLVLIGVRDGSPRKRHSNYI